MSAARNANHMRLQALLAASKMGHPRLGLVSGYKPDQYLVKVRLQPDDIETGWIPIATPMIGQKWGVYFAPSQGDQAIVLFQEGDNEVGFCVGFLPSLEDPAPTVPSTEMHLIHKTGAYLKLLTDGSINAVAPGDHKTGSLVIALADGTVTLTSETLDDQGNATSTAQIKLSPDGTIASQGAWTHTGTFHNTSDLTSDGNVSFTGSSVTHGAINIGKTHKHGGVQTGASTSDVPQ